jgi:hypothetical protein
VTKRICDALRGREPHPAAPRAGHFVRRLQDGSFLVVPPPATPERDGQAARVPASSRDER